MDIINFIAKTRKQGNSTIITIPYIMGLDDNKAYNFTVDRKGFDNEKDR